MGGTKSAAKKHAAPVDVDVDKLDDEINEAFDMLDNELTKDQRELVFKKVLTRAGVRRVAGFSWSGGLRGYAQATLTVLGAVTALALLGEAVGAVTGWDTIRVSRLLTSSDEPELLTSDLSD